MVETKKAIHKHIVEPILTPGLLALTIATGGSCLGQRYKPLIFTRIEPYYESLFFISFVSFVLIYMVLLIKDLDNPFGYYERGALTENVSLKPLLDLRSRLSAVPPEAHEGPKREVAPHLGERVAAGRKGKRRR